jgi:flagellar protein FlgJ
MKAGESWPGKSVEVTTLEFRGGRPFKESASFRAYDSWLEALEDYRALITGSDRYRAAVDAAAEPDRYATELQNAGYATDPDYASKIRRVLGSEPMLNAARLLQDPIGTGE